MSKTKNISALIIAGSIIGAPLTLNNEGMSLRPYYDGAGIKTWCVGETEAGYKDKFTTEECVELFNLRYGYYSLQTSSLYNETGEKIITPQAHAAFTDMSYNIGLSAMGKSSMIKYLNHGDLANSCGSILKYKYVKSKDCSKKENGCYGIWDRRQRMYNLCMQGVRT